MHPYTIPIGSLGYDIPSLADPTIEISDQLKLIRYDIYRHFLFFEGVSFSKEQLKLVDHSDAELRRISEYIQAQATTNTGITADEFKHITLKYDQSLAAATDRVVYEGFIERSGYMHYTVPTDRTQKTIIKKDTEGDIVAIATSPSFSLGGSSPATAEKQTAVFPGNVTTTWKLTDDGFVCESIQPSNQALYHLITDDLSSYQTDGDGSADYPDPTENPIIQKLLRAAEEEEERKRFVSILKLRKKILHGMRAFMENDTRFPRSPWTSDTIAAGNANSNFTSLITERILQIDTALREPTDINELRQLISKPTFSMPAASTRPHYPYTRTLLWATIGVACIGVAVAVLFPASIPFLATVMAAHAWAAPATAFVAGVATAASFLQAKQQHPQYQKKKTTYNQSVTQQQKRDETLSRLLTGLNTKYEPVSPARRQRDVEEQEQEQEQEQESTIAKDTQLLSLALANNNQELQDAALTIIGLSEFVSACKSPQQAQAIIDILQDALAKRSATNAGSSTSSTPDHRSSIQNALTLWQAIKTEKETPSDARQLVGSSIS